MSGLILPIRTRRSFRDKVVFPSGIDFNAGSGRSYPGTFTRTTNAWLASQVFPPGVPRTVSYGGGTLVYIEGAQTNLVKNSVMKAAETIAITAQNYTVAVVGSGSLTLSGAYSGTVTAAKTLTFKPAASGNLTITPNGQVLHAQLSAAVLIGSRIVTTGATVARGDDTWQINGLTPFIGPGKEWAVSIAIRDIEALTTAPSGFFIHRDLFSWGTDATDFNYVRVTRNSSGARFIWSGRGGTRTDMPGTQPTVSATGFQRYVLNFDGINLKVYQNAVLLSTYVPKIPDPSQFRIGGRAGNTIGYAAAFAWIAPGAPLLNIPFFRPRQVSAAEIAAEDAVWAAALNSSVLPGM